MVTSPKELGHEKDCAGKGQQHIQKTDPSSRQRGRPTETIWLEAMKEKKENTSQ
jgi:hypothetical protein